jgi:LmbE family N-acetylglucosaminyl deacetylase
VDPALVISPHLDDAALSCGQLLAGWPNAVVVTVFAGTPADPTISTTYDRNCGFPTAVEAMNRRRREDDAAMSHLKSIPVRLDFVDHQYDDTIDLPGMAAAIRAAIDDAGPAKVLAPLGLAHQDHVATATASAMAMAGVDVPFYVYEEIPSRVLWPEAVPPRLAWWAQRYGREPVLEFVGDGPRRRKETALAQYKSQLWALSKWNIYVPERFWRVA